jgi:hypothetical protein
MKGESRIQYKYSKYRLYTTGVTCDNSGACDNSDDVRGTLTEPLVGVVDSLGIYH